MRPVNEIHIPRRTPPFGAPSLDGLTRTLEGKNNGGYRNQDLYFRDGFKELARLEDHIAQLHGVEDGRILLTNSGMSAINTAIDLAKLRTGDAVLHGNQSYSQTAEYIKDLRERGIITPRVDTNSLSEIEEVLVKYKPKVVVFETIGNGTEAQVLDVEGFLQIPALKEVDPLIILDNTLPTNTHFPLAERIKDSGLRIIGIESATKSYALNQETGGILFASSKDLVEELHTKRKRIGSTPNRSAVDEIGLHIPKSKEQFDDENRRIAENTTRLADACAAAQGHGRLFQVGHPLVALSDHPTSRARIEAVREQYPNGATPVFFIYPDWSEPFTSYEIVDAMATYLNNGDVHFSQSFAFDKTGILYSDRDQGNYVRIAGGLEDDATVKRLQGVFYWALTSLANGR